MEITSKIKLENGVFVCIHLIDDKLHYELEYNQNDFDGEPYDKFRVYERTNTGGTFKYKNSYFKKIRLCAIDRNRPLKSGVFLFVFNRTKIFIEFIDNNISYELEDTGIEDDSDLV